MELEIALIAAGSALAGAVIGVAGGLWADQVRWKRQPGVRWEDRKRHAYVEFLDALSGIQFALVELSQHADVGDRLRIARDALQTAGHELDIVAPADVRVAAKRTTESVKPDLDQLPPTSHSTNLPAFNRAQKALMLESDKFATVARNSLSDKHADG